MLTMYTPMTPDATRATGASGRETDAPAIWRALEHLEGTYPGFGSWFWDKVAPGLATGTRHASSRFDAGSIRGVVIAKRMPDERKLCTIWVRPDARGRGLASELVDEACDWLGTRTPLLTVPEERMAELRPLVDRRGFELRETLRSYYRPFRSEYVFNGQLGPRADC